jgi:pimeloyl-ACP methyl ester carboxylesterase
MNTLSTPTPVSFREGDVDLSGRRLHFVEYGAGPPVVLLHGYTDSWASFRLVLPLLAGRRCLALDQRGHGRSGEADDYLLDGFAGDVAEFLRSMGITSAAVVGHSMGSFVARRLALARPDLVDRLVLVGGALRIDVQAVRELKAQVAQFRGEVPRAFVEEFQASCVYRRDSVPGWFFDECVGVSRGVPARVWRAALAGMAADDDSPDLTRVGCPALVLGGAEDSVFGREDQAALARALPGGRLLLYEGCGHSPHWEQPARFAGDVLGFLGAAD